MYICMLLTWNHRPKYFCTSIWGTVWTLLTQPSESSKKPLINGTTQKRNNKLFILASKVLTFQSIYFQHLDAMSYIYIGSELYDSHIHKFTHVRTYIYITWYHDLIPISILKFTIPSNYRTFWTRNVIFCFILFLLHMTANVGN